MQSEIFSNHKELNLENESIQFELSYNSYKNFLKNLDEMGDELRKFREALLSHQNKVRKIIMDSGVNDT